MSKNNNRCKKCGVQISEPILATCQSCGAEFETVGKWSEAEEALNQAAQISRMSRVKYIWRHSVPTSLGFAVLTLLLAHFAINPQPLFIYIWTLVAGAIIGFIMGNLNYSRAQKLQHCQNVEES